MQKLSCLHERCVELTFRSNLLLLDGEARNLAWVNGDILERGETKRLTVQGHLGSVYTCVSTSSTAIVTNSSGQDQRPPQWTDLGTLPLIRYALRGVNHR